MWSITKPTQKKNFSITNNNPAITRGRGAAEKRKEKKKEKKKKKGIRVLKEECRKVLLKR